MPDLLDTNVVSELRKPRPEPFVVAYFFSRPAEDLFISTVTLAELSFGIQSQVDPTKRAALNHWLEGEIRPVFVDRTLPITEAVMLRWRILLEKGRKSGRIPSQPDLILAATALEYNFTLVTRNTRDFDDISDLRLLNPWNSLI